MIHIYLSIYQIIVKPKSKILKSKDHYWVMWKNSKSKMQLYHIKVGSLSKMMKKFFWIRKIHPLTSPEKPFLCAPLYPGRRCLRYCLNADFIGQNWKWKSTKFFFKTKKYTYRPWKKCKKIQKKPGTGPVPGLKVFFRVKIVVPGFLKFFSWTICIFFSFEK